MKKLVWLASYPKSGNTWLRTFLLNLLGETDTPAHINELTEPTYMDHAASINNFHFYSLLKHTELRREEIAELRPAVYEELSKKSEELVYLKTHDAFTMANGQPTFPASASYGAIYIIRNPLDVVISYSIYLNMSIDDTIKRMGNTDEEIFSDPQKIVSQLPQLLGSWSQHVISWTTQTSFPVLVIRYEDLLSAPIETFGSIVNFLQLNKSKKQMEKAIGFSNFETLKTQEMGVGFIECPPDVPSFFRQGSTGQWKDVLTEKQKQRMLKTHGDVMHLYRYAT